MKKAILFIAVTTSAVFVSCEKERDCSCTTTSTFAGVSTYSTQVRTYKDVTKKQGKTLCASYTQTDTSGVVTTVDCKLE